MKRRRKQRRRTQPRRLKNRQLRFIDRLTLPAILLVFLVLLYLTWSPPRLGKLKVLLSDANTIRCPVGGMPIKNELHVTTDEGRVYFCCNGCIKRFNDEPTRYAEFVEAQRNARRGSTTRTSENR